LAEIGSSQIDVSRLYELTGSRQPGVATAARSRLVEILVRRDVAAALTTATEPTTQVVVAVKLMAEVLMQLPASLATFSTAELLLTVSEVGEDAKIKDLTILFFDSILKSRGPDVEAMARALAPDFQGTILELLDAASMADRTTRIHPA